MLNKETILQQQLQLEVKKRESLELLLQEKNNEVLETNANLSKIIKQNTLELNGVLENIIDSYVLMDLYGNVLKMNKAAKEFFGYDCDKEHFNVTTIIYEKDAEYAFASFTKLQKEGAFKDYQARVYNKSKTVKWVQINAKTVNDTEGNPTFAHGIIRDISKKIKQDTDFENQKKLLDVIVDNSPLGIVLADKNQRIIKANRAFQKMLGYTEKELKNRSIKDVSFEKDNTVLQKKIAQVMRGEIESFSAEKKYLRKNNTTLSCNVNVSVVKNKSGGVKYISAFIEDITEVQKRENLLEFLNNLMSSILGETKKSEISKSISEKIKSLLGFDNCEIIFYNKNKQVLHHFSEIFEEKTTKIEENRGSGLVGYVAKTGKALLVNDVAQEELYFEVNSATKSEITVPILYQEEVIGIINSESTTLNFYTEEQLKTLKTVANVISTKLFSAISLDEKLAAERDKEILLTNLTKTNKELKDFAHIVSHDLKSPLRSMNAMLNWLQEDCNAFLKPTINSKFDFLFKKVNKMDLLINGILSYTSVDKIERLIHTIDLNDIVKEVEEDILNTSKDIIINKKNLLPIVNADSYRMLQVFQNLMSNAIKYNSKPHKLIEIDAKEQADFWEISIKDNGIGIQKKYHTKIFEIFQMLEESDDSSGIGLSIVKKIIDFYGGKIWLDSKINHGTTFFFTLPKK